MYLAKPSFSLRAELFQHADPNLDTTRAQPGNALTAHHRIGVGGRRHDPCHACGHQRIRAGFGSSVVAAGLEGHIGGRPAGQPACLLEGNNLGVVPLVELMEAFAHQNIVPLGACLDEHAADRRVRRRKADGLLSLPQSTLHPQLVNLLVALRHGGQLPSRESTKALLSKGNRSSAFSPTPT